MFNPIQPDRLSTCYHNMHGISEWLEKNDKYILFWVGVTFVLGYIPFLISTDKERIAIVHDWLHLVGTIVAVVYVILQFAVIKFVGVLHSRRYDRDYKPWWRFVLTWTDWLFALVRPRADAVQSETLKRSARGLFIDDRGVGRKAFIDCVATMAFNCFPKAKSLEDRREYFSRFLAKNPHCISLVVAETSTGSSRVVGYMSILPLHENVAENHLDGVANQYLFTGHDLMESGESPTDFYFQAIVINPELQRQGWIGEFWPVFGRQIAAMSRRVNRERVRIYAEEHTLAGRRMLSKVGFDLWKNKSHDLHPIWIWRWHHQMKEYYPGPQEVAGEHDPNHWRYKLAKILHDELSPASEVRPTDLPPDIGT